MGAVCAQALLTGSELLARLRRAEDALAGTAGADAVRTHLHLSEGYAAAALIEASKEADLLVVGSRGHGSWSGLLLGLHCSTHAHCPVVIVRDLDPTSP